MTPQATEVLQELLAGNERFRTGRSRHFRYTATELGELARRQNPVAAVIACADSRVCPEILFDQPLGALFVSRVPGNVAADSAKWMLEIALKEFGVPLVMVLGHTGCLAVGQLLEGDRGGPGGPSRYSVLSAVYEARSRRPENLYLAAVEENARQAMDALARDSYTLRSAMVDGTTSCACAVYEMETGVVRWLST